MTLEQILDEIRENFTFFNKPKGSIYRVVRFTAQENCLAEYDALVKIYEDCCVGTPEEPRLLVRHRSGIAYVQGFKLHHAAYKTEYSEVFNGTKQAFVLYSGASEATNNYFKNQATIEGELSPKFNEIRIPLLDKASSTLGPLGRVLTSGELVSKTMVGNCGDCCDLVSYRLLKNQLSEAIQVVQVNFTIDNRNVFSHCFAVIDATKRFSPNLDGLERAVVVDPWNFYAMPFLELIKDTAAETEYMRFIFSEIDVFKIHLVFDSSQSKIALDSTKPLTMPSNQMTALCLIADELKIKTRF